MDAAMIRVSRRQLLKTGLAGGALLWLARGWMERATQPVSAGWTPRQRAALRRVAEALVGDLLPAGVQRELRLDAAVKGIEAAVFRLPPSLRAEFADLLNLMTGSFTRRVVLRLPDDWSAVDLADVRAWLARWQASRIALFQSAAQALVQLVHAAWYGQAANWGPLGYAGPPPTILQAREAP